MRSKKKIYEEFIGNGQFGIDFEKKHILEAMDEYAREVLREELINYTIWHQNKMFGCHALKEAIEHGVNEYLKEKEK